MCALDRRHFGKGVVCDGVRWWSTLDSQYEWQNCCAPAESGEFHLCLNCVMRIYANTHSISLGVRVFGRGVAF